MHEFEAEPEVVVDVACVGGDRADGGTDFVGGLFGGELGERFE